MTDHKSRPDLAWKLWIYTNYDCNLSCSYCVAESTPRAPRNAIGLENACRIVDEADEDHFVRPLARRGFSTEGMDVGPGSLVPEITVTRNGIYWHPLASPGSDDMLVTSNIFPLSAAVACIRKNLAAQPDGVEALIEFT